MAQSMHKRLRNRFRSRRYAHPLDLDEDITEALLMWKYGESDYPTFYNGDSNIISEEGEEWLLQNQIVADRFIEDTYKNESNIKQGDRYTRLFEDDMKRNACYPLWPEGMGGVVPLVLWALSWYYQHQNSYAWYMYYFLLISHTIETILVYLWLEPVKFTWVCTLAWMIYAFICGWPITGRAKILSNIKLRKAERSENKRLQAKFKKQVLKKSTSSGSCNSNKSD